MEPDCPLAYFLRSIVVRRFIFDGQPYSDNFDQEDESSILYADASDVGCGVICIFHHYAAVVYSWNFDNRIRAVYSGWRGYLFERKEKIRVIKKRLNNQPLF